VAATKTLLLAFLGAPTAWALHLAVSYFLVSLGCGAQWQGARDAVIVATILCAVTAGAAGVFGWRRWKAARGSAGGAAFETDRVPQFLAISGAVLAALFTGAIILAGMSPLFLPLCSPS
jgi:hypothetical protein